MKGYVLCFAASMVLAAITGCSGGGSTQAGSKQVATPSFSPAPGSFTSAQQVTISVATKGAKIYYTTDGSTPGYSSAVYSAPIPLSTITTIRAFAMADGYLNSSVASGTYTINIPVAAVPTFSPAPGSYTSTQQVTIADATAGATIYYTTDGSTPGLGSALYSAPIPLSTTTTINAIAAAPGYTNSAEATGAYTISAEIPVNASLPSFTSSFGGPYVGSTLTADIGTWTNNPSHFACTWSVNSYVAQVDASCGNATTFVLANYYLGGTVSLSVTASNPGGTSGPATYTGMGAVSFLPTGAAPVSTFLDSIGVQTHVGYTDAGSPYHLPAQVAQALQSVGIKHVRDSFPTAGNPSMIQTIASGAGAKFDILMDGSGSDYSTILDNIQNNIGIVESVEGANEVDNFYAEWTPDSGSTYKNAVAMQQQMWQDLKCTGCATASLPIYSLSVGSISNVPNVGNISSYVDMASGHIYPQYDGYPWDNDANSGGGIAIYPLVQSLTIQANSEYYPGQPAVTNNLAPGKPNVLTEAGFWTQPASNGLTTDIQAKETLTLLLDTYALGIYRTYLYELFDEYNDAGGTTEQDHFGLFNYDYTPKQSATTLANLQAILADSGTLASPGNFEYTLAGMPSTKLYGIPTAHSLLFERSDGVLFLALWNDTPIWNVWSTPPSPITVTPSSVILTPAAAPSQMVEYEPTESSGTTPTQTVSGPSISVSLADHPIFIMIKP